MQIPSTDAAFKVQPIDGRNVQKDIKALIERAKGADTPKLPVDVYRKKPAIDGEQKIGMTMGGFFGGLTGFLAAASKEALATGFGLRAAAGLGAGILGGVGFAAALIFGLPPAIKGIKKLFDK